MRSRVHHYGEPCFYVSILLVVELAFEATLSLPPNSRAFVSILLVVELAFEVDIGLTKKQLSNLFQSFL